MVKSTVILPPGSSDDFASTSLRIPQTLAHTTTTQTTTRAFTPGTWITVSNNSATGGSTEVYIRFHGSSSTTLVTANDLKLGVGQERHYQVQNESRYVSARSVDGATAFDVRVYQSSI